jgi:pyruvate/2-oxoglutarate dehydrogenase complex dihydrolipoamide acyltransferase (E2) component
VPSPVTIPNLGDGVQSGILIRFLVAEGDPVTRGDPLFEVDTDKVTQEVEAEADGVLLKVLGTDGEEYPVGATIAWIGDPEDPLP